MAWSAPSRRLEQCCYIVDFNNLQRKHDDVIKWKHFPRNWPFVREIHRSPMNFPHKGQWRGALMFSLIYAWINDWVNNREAGDLRRQHGHYDVIVMFTRNSRFFIEGNTFENVCKDDVHFISASSLCSALVARHCLVIRYCAQLSVLDTSSLIHYMIALHDELFSFINVWYVYDVFGMTE